MQLINSFLPIWLPRDLFRQLRRRVSLGHGNVCSYSELLWLWQQDCQRKATNSLDRTIVPVLSVRRPWLYSKFVGVHHGTRECCNLIGPFHLDCENELVNCTVDFISLRTLRKRERAPCPMQMYWARATLTLP